jgi:hypothetical protein
LGKNGHPKPHPHPLAGILGYLPSKGPASFLPVDEVQVPCRLEGNPSSWPSPLPALGILWDTRISAGILGGKGHPDPLAGICWYQRIAGIRQRIAGIRQRIADICDGLCSPISKLNIQYNNSTNKVKKLKKTSFTKIADKSN